MEDYKKPEHGGNIYELSVKSGVPIDACTDFSANINPLGPPSWLKEVLLRGMTQLVHYPDRLSTRFREALSERFGIGMETIVAGNGSTELMYALPRCIDVKKALIPVPSYGDYEDAARMAGLPVKLLNTREEEKFQLNLGGLEKKLAGESKPVLVFIGQPNNPTGSSLDRDRLINCIQRFPRHIFCIDEAFADFIEDEISCLGEEMDNLIVVRSLTKFYAIPGLRLGWLYTGRDLAARIRDVLPTWSVNSISQMVGARAVLDEGYRVRTLDLLKTERNRLRHSLEAIPAIQVFSGEANFLFGRLENTDAGVTVVGQYLEGEGIALRNCGTFRGLSDRYFRVAVRTGTENDRLINLLRGFFESRDG
jgi:adenosylcobyric acid synthase